MKKPRNQRPKIILVSNSLSTSNRRGLPAVRALAEHHPALAHLEGASVGQLYRQLESYRGRAPELLILNGGDGTVHAALTYILNRKIFKAVPPIALLSGGMTNLIAKDLGTAGPAARMLETLLDRYQYGDLARHFKSRDLVRVDFGKGREPEFGFFFGAGIITNGIRMCREELYPRGIKGLPSQLIAFAAHAGSVVMGVKPGSLAYSPPMRLSLPGGRTIAGELGLVIATTLRGLLYGARTRIEAGRFPVFTMEPRFSTFLKVYGHAINGTIEQAPPGGFTFGFEREVRIDGGPEFIMEGEIFTPAKDKSFTVSCADPLTFVSFSKE